MAKSLEHRVKNQTHYCILESLIKNSIQKGSEMPSYSIEINIQNEVECHLSHGTKLLNTRCTGKLSIQVTSIRRVFINEELSKKKKEVSAFIE